MKNVGWFSILVAAVLLTFAVTTSAQQQGKIFRIGYLDNSTASGSAVFVKAFREELSKLGWIEEKNFAMEYRFAEQQPERLPSLAAELVRLKVDVFLCSSTPSILAAKKATTTIPIVMASSGDAVEAGLVPSLDRPGGNVTGLTSLSPELAGKRLEILKEAVRGASRVGFLWFSGGPGVSARLQLNEIKTVASALDVRLQEIEIKVLPSDVDSVFRTATRQKVNAVITASQRVIYNERKQIAELAIKYRLPTIYPQKEHVDEGGLMSYGPDMAASYRRAAVYVDKILKGSNPADLPVERPMKFELVINLKTAKQIGLTIPPNVLARADRVIK